MPGSVSDSYDPEFGTAANVDEIRQGIADASRTVTILLQGAERKYILDVVRMKCGPTITGDLTEREWRIIRWALERTSDSL